MAGLTKAPSTTTPAQAGDTSTTATGEQQGATTHEGNSNEATHGSADLASLLFGAGAPEDAGEGENPDPEGREKTSGESGTAEGDDDNTDDDNGDGDEGGAGGGESENGDNDTDAGADGSAVFCSFDGQDYTEDQVTNALKNHGVFEKFAESVKPLVADITSYGQIAESLKVAATTETDKMITELTGLLNSGRLDSQQHQQAYVQLMQAQERKRVLDDVVEQEQTQRKQAIQQVRIQNARRVGVALLHSGWTQAQMMEVEGFSKSVFTPEAYADNLSPELMELLRDAMMHRKARADTEKKLQTLGKKAVKVSTNKPSKPAASGQGKDLGALLFGG